MIRQNAYFIIKRQRVCDVILPAVFRACPHLIGAFCSCVILNNIG